MKKIRIGYNQLNVNSKYALAYIWFVIAVIAIALGCKVNTNYFIIIPMMLTFQLFLFNKAIHIRLMIPLIMEIVVLTVYIAEKNITVGRVVSMELLIAYFGSYFFRGHAG